MSMIDSLNWRYATTKFDNSKAVSEQHVNDLKEIIRLTPASWGFQFYKVLVISNNDLKAKLLPSFYGNFPEKKEKKLFLENLFFNFLK